MGCIWSREDANRCMHCNRRPVNNLVFVDHVCEICISQSSRITRGTSYQLKPHFGEYRCSCGRFWTSNLSWARSYQVCKRCRKPVYAHTQRDLRPTDYSSSKENRQEHQRDFCQMCQQLGRYCGSFGNNEKRRRKR